MTIEKALKICHEMQLWRRGDAPYDEDVPAKMPYTASEYGEALDKVMEKAEANDWALFVRRIIILALLAVTIFSVTLTVRWIRDMETVITAEEYLMFPSMYEVSTEQVNGVTIYQVREK